MVPFKFANLSVPEFIKTFKFSREMLPFLFFAIILQLFVFIKGSKTALSTQEESMLAQFKVVLMHFIEPLLVDAKIKGYEMEGHNTPMVLGALHPLISKTAGSIKSKSEQSLLHDFSQKLSEGLSLYQNHMALADTEVTYPPGASAAQKISSLSNVIKNLAEGKSIYVPFSYSMDPVGHAMSMVIKGSSLHTVDITVINTGQGAEYNKFVKDPSGLSVTLRVPWLEFVNVPKTFLTGDNNWFAHGLIALDDPKYMKLIGLRDDNIANYIYGSFLGNLAKYFKPTEATEERQMMLQLSGSCVYSALMATLLYFSKSQPEFELARARIGLQLFDEFWNAFSQKPIFSGIMSDANEYQARALLANLASGLARQAAEVWRAFDPHAFKGLILKNEADETGKDCTAGKLDMQLIKDLVDRAMKVLNYYKNIKIDAQSSKFLMKDSLKTLLSPSSLSKWVEPVSIQIDGKDLYKGTDFASDKHAIAAISKPIDSTLPQTISSLEQLIAALEKALLKAKNYYQCPNVPLERMLLDKIYPIFKLADQGKGAWYHWVSSSSKKEQLKDAMKVGHDITRQLFQYSHGRMYLEEFVALQQLHLLTWKAAQQYDKLDGSHFKLYTFSAPVSSRTMHFKPFKPQDDTPMDNTYLDPKLQFESILGPIETETVALMKRTDAELEKGGERFMPVDELFFSALLISDAEYLAKVINNNKSIKETLKRLWDKYNVNCLVYQLQMQYFSALKILKDALGMSNIAAEGPSKIHEIPHFYYPFFTSIFFANMQYTRPSGPISKEYTPFGLHATPNFEGIILNVNDPAFCYPTKKIFENVPGFLTMSDFSVFSVYFDDHREYENKDKLRYFGIFRAAELRTKLRDGKVTDFQALSSTKIDALLEWIENSQSAAVFRSYNVYHAIDRMLSNSDILTDTKFYQHQRLIQSLYAIVDKEVTNFLKKYSTSSLEQKQSLLHRGLQAAFVLARYMQNLLVLKVETDKLAPTISDNYAKLYQLYVPFLKVDSVYLLDNSDIASVHALLFIMNSFSSSHLTNYVKKITFEFSSGWLKDKNTPTAMAALAYYHKFVYMMNIERKETRNRFTDIYDFSKMQLPKFPEEHRDFLASAIQFTLFPLVQSDADKKWTVTWHDSDLVKFQAPIKESELSTTQIEERKKALAKNGKVPDLFSTYRLRLSSGEVYFGPTRLVSRQKFVDNESFKAFFGSRLLSYALHGDIHMLARSTMYNIKYFRGLDIHYLFSLSKKQVFEAYRHYKNEYWNWIKTGSELEKELAGLLKLFAFKGRKLYYRKGVDDKTFHVIMIGDLEEKPFLELTIAFAKAKAVEDTKITMTIPELTSADGKPINWKLLQTSKVFNELPKSLRSFAQDEFISVIQEEGYGPSMMLGPYRHELTPNLPVILKNTCKSDWLKASCFKPTFDMKLEIDENQAVLDGTVIPKALILVNPLEKSRQLYYPRIVVPNKPKRPIYRGDQEYFKKEMEKYEKDLKDYNNPPPSNLKTTNTFIIDSAVVIGDEIISKSRENRLSLAYKFLQVYMTKFALKFLHPAKSIDHNTPFSNAELKLLDNIVMLDNKHLEVIAVRMAALLHRSINEITFPEKDGRSNLINSDEFNLMIQVVGMYLGNLRVIPGKFWIHRLFPEVWAQVKEKSASGTELGNVFWDQIGDLYARYCGQYFGRSLFHPLQLSDKEDHQKFKHNLAIFFQTTLVKYHIAAETKQKATDPINPAQTPSILRIGSIFYPSFPDNSHSWPLYGRLSFRSHLQSMSPDSGTYTLVPDVVDAIVKCACVDNNFRSKFSKHFVTLKGCDIDKVAELFASEITSSCNTGIDEPVRQMLSQNNILQDLDLEKTFEVLSTDIKAHSFDQIVSDKKVEVVPNDVIKEVQGLMGLLHKTNPTKSPSPPPQEYLAYFAESAKKSQVLQGLLTSIQSYTSKKSNLVNVDNLEKFLKQLVDLSDRIIKKTEEELKKITERLVAIVNKEEKNISMQIDSLLSLKKEKTFHSLYGCYYSGSLDCYRRKFPQVKDQNDIKKLHDESFRFYSKTTLRDYFLELKKRAVEMQGQKLDSLSQDEITVLTDELSKVNDFNSRYSTPGVLNFEYRSEKYRLKAEQTKDLEKLLSNKNGKFDSIVLQRMMAAGKTVVLGTLATILKARHEGTLSLLIPPSSLFASNAAAMQGRSYKYFKSRGRVLHFHRFKVPEMEGAAKKVFNNLVWDYAMMQTAREKRDYIIVSPESLHSFQNSFLEFCDNIRNLQNENLKDSYFNILKVMAMIYHTFLTQSTGILDEIDMTMNPKKELNYPTRSREGYNMLAAVLTADLIEFTATSKEAQKVGLYLVHNNQAGLTESAFKRVKTVWLDYIAAQVKDKSSFWYLKLVANLPEKMGDKQVTAADFVMEFLRSESPSDYHKVLSDLLKTNSNVINALIIMKRQIDSYLKEALKGTVNEHYGPAGSVRPEIKIAVPYLSANTPSSASVFADRWETLNKSLFMTLVVPLSEEETKEFMVWLKEQIEIEVKIHNHLTRSVTFSNFLKLGKAAESIDILACSVEDETILKELKKMLSRPSKPAIRLRFTHLLDKVIAPLDFPVEQITSNALNMASMLGTVQGYSGTIDNVNCLPAHVVAQAHVDHMENDRDNGGIVKKLLIDSANSALPEIGQIFTNDPDQIIGELLKAYKTGKQNVRFNALIDVGAFLKNFRNKQVAAAILKAWKGDGFKAALYYDEESNMLEYLTIDGGTGQLPDPDEKVIAKTTGSNQDQTFTFYDQRHITGSDIAQTKFGKGLLTIGPKVLLRDILQGTLRMRKFMSTQQVYMITTPDTRKYLADLRGQNPEPAHLRVSDAIELGSFNEDVKQTNENVRIAYAKLTNEMRSVVIKKLITTILSENSALSDIKTLFAKHRSLFVRSLREEPINWLLKTSPKAAKDALQGFVIAMAFDQDSKQSDAELANAAKKLLNDCPDRLHPSDSVLCFVPQTLPALEEVSSMLSNGAEVQTEINMAVLMETDQKSQVEPPINRNRMRKARAFTAVNVAKDDSTLFEDSDLENLYTKVTEIHRVSHQSKEVQDFLESFLTFKETSVEVSIEENLINFIKRPVSECPYQLFSQFNGEGTNVLAVFRKDRHSFVLVSSYVAQHIKERMPGTKLPEDQVAYLTDLDGTIIASTSVLPDFDKKPITIFDVKTDDIVKRAYHDISLLNGSLPRLLHNPHFSKLFTDSWLIEGQAAHRMSLLLNRMKALSEKAKFLFDEDDSLFIISRQVAQGDTIALENLKSGKFAEAAEKQKITAADIKATGVEAASNYSKTQIVLNDDDKIDDDSAYSPPKSKPFDLSSFGQYTDPDEESESQGHGKSGKHDKSGQSNGAGDMSSNSSADPIFIFMGVFVVLVLGSVGAFYFMRRQKSAAELYRERFGA